MKQLPNESLGSVKPQHVSVHLEETTALMSLIKPQFSAEPKTMDLNFEPTVQTLTMFFPASADLTDTKAKKLTPQPRQHMFLDSELSVMYTLNLYNSL